VGASPLQQTSAHQRVVPTRAELQRLAAAASTQAAAVNAATAASRVLEIDLISRHSVAGGEDDDDDEDDDEGNPALHGSTDVAGLGAESVLGDSSGFAPAAPLRPPRACRRLRLRRALLGHPRIAGPSSSGTLPDLGLKASMDPTQRTAPGNSATSLAAAPEASETLNRLDEEEDDDRESALTHGSTHAGGDGCPVAEAAVQDLALQTDHGDADSVHAESAAGERGAVASSGAASSPATMGGRRGVARMEVGTRVQACVGDCNLCVW